MLGMRPARSAVSKTSRERPSICTTRKRRRAVASAGPSLAQRAIRSARPWSERARSSSIYAGTTRPFGRIVDAFTMEWGVYRDRGASLHLTAHGNRDDLEEPADDSPVLP